MVIDRKPSQPREVQLNSEFVPPPLDSGLREWFQRLQWTLTQDRRTIEDALAKLKSVNDELLLLINAQAGTIQNLTVRLQAAENRAILIRDGNVAVDAAIRESKLSLQFPTHDNANDPTTKEKLALQGTFGDPGPTNRYVTDLDPRVNVINGPNVVEVDFTAVPASEWPVVHNLGYYPAGVQVLNASRELMFAYIVDGDLTQFTVYHTYNASGYVRYVRN